MRGTTEATISCPGLVTGIKSGTLIGGVKSGDNSVSGGFVSGPSVTSTFN